VTVEEKIKILAQYEPELEWFCDDIDGDFCCYISPDRAAQRAEQFLRLKKTSTLEGAVEVLNGFKHNNHSDWTTDDNDEPMAFCPSSKGPFNILFKFEAIAVAEKYLRDKP
jgi:hypothetical protein